MRFASAQIVAETRALGQNEGAWAVGQNKGLLLRYRGHFFWPEFTESSLSGVIPAFDRKLPNVHMLTCELGLQICPNFC